MDNTSLDTDLRERTHAAQVAAHYAHVPAMIIAPCLGGLFSVWVLSGAVNDRAMYLGFGSILLLSLVRYLVYRRFKSATPEQRARHIWARLAIGFSAASGALWGGAAVFLYPPHDPAYQIYMVLIFALIPLAPIAALACYLPTFYAYYIPCALPFLAHLVLQRDRAGWASALLLLMLMAATITFARKYYFDFFAAVRLRLLVEQQRDAVQAASQSKTRFLAAASHDLRQPLHAVTLFAEALQGDLHDDAARGKQRGLLEAAHALRGLLDRLLDVAQLDAGGITACNTAFALDALLHKLAREFAPLARERGLAIRVVPTRRWAASDPELLENLLRNLLGNALRYTHSGGVVLGCRKRGERILVQVSDTGIGIEAAHHQRIFEEFFQVDNPGRERNKGLGLGLSVVSRIARLLDAEVRLASLPGRGTTFTVALPLVDAAAVETSAPVAVMPDSPLEGRRVLFVDNDAGIRDACRALTGTWGCELLAVGGETEALALIDAQPTDAPIEAMILDYTLAQSRSGVQLAQLIERRMARRIPTLIITGDISERPKSEAAAAGYLLARKPLRPGNLKALLGHLLT